MNTELIFSIIIFIVPVLILSILMYIAECYSLTNKKKRTNDNLINHIAEDFHDILRVKIYEEN
jgi:hypothetical protein